MVRRNSSSRLAGPSEAGEVVSRTRLDKLIPGNGRLAVGCAAKQKAEKRHSRIHAAMVPARKKEARTGIDAREVQRRAVATRSDYRAWPQMSRLDFFRQIGELARAKQMPCIVTATEQELIRRRDTQKREIAKAERERKLSA